jgi:fatty-acyl-CoA synthase
MSACDPLTIPGILARSAAARPTNDAFVFPDARETYGDLLIRARSVARSMRGLGVCQGDAIGILMPNCLEFTHVLLGAAFAGALVVTINSRLAPPELRYVITDSGMKALFTTDLVADRVDYVDRLRKAFPELDTAATGETPPLRDAPALDNLVLLGTGEGGGLLSRRQFEAAGRNVEREVTGEDVSRHDPYIMMYTSGTTAKPKGCVLAHEAVVRSGLEVGRRAFRLEAGDRMWNPLPMFHVSAQAPMIGVLDAGAAYLSMTHFDPGAALQMISEREATFLFPAYPTITQPLLTHPEYRPELFAKVRAVLTVGPPELLRSFQERLPYSEHLSCYGSTELGGIAVVGYVGDPVEERLTCGKPLEGIEVEVRNPDTGSPLPAGEIGVLWVRGYNLFLGYHNDPEKTAAAFDGEGWFDTGDLASLDERGNVTFRGRVKDMLKVGGENVSCLEVEAVLAGHPAVAVAAVVGIPDPKYDEVPVAFVELRPDADGDADELLRHCNQALARFKVPRAIHFVTEWPMSATKIQKFRLRDMLLGQSPVK